MSFEQTATSRPAASMQLSGPTTAVAGACSAAFTVQLLDANHMPTTAQNTITASLTGGSSGGFFSDPACTQATSSVTIAQGAGTAEFYFLDRAVESPTLQTSTRGLGVASEQISITAAAAVSLAFSSQPSATGSVGVPLSAQPAITAHDAFGNVATGFGGSVTLSAFNDSACTSAASGSVNTTANPVAAAGGTAAFGGVSYSAAATIYLGGTSSGLTTACSQAVVLSSSIALAAGTSTTCALVNGRVQCWGFNGSGTLGNGNNTNYSTPQQVVGLSTGAMVIGMGSQHACAGTANGLLCWGLNASGQLGTGSQVNSNIPATVSGISGSVTQVAGGDSHTCALINGSVLCWGDNTEGRAGHRQLHGEPRPGRGAGLAWYSRLDRHGLRIQLCGAHHGRGVLLGLQRLWPARQRLHEQQPHSGAGAGAAGPVTSIAPGIENTCALVSGAVYCWGNNDFGQLGDGSTTDSMTPVQVSGLSSGVTRLLSGGQNFSCVTLQGGAVQCWGQDTRGQLGDNGASGSQSTGPVQVVGLTSGYTILHAGYIHACASNGTQIFCWGWGSSGQLGDGQTVESKVPVEVRVTEKKGPATY